MRMNAVVAAACGVVALSALAIPAAHADERFGDTDITRVVGVRAPSRVTEGALVLTAQEPAVTMRSYQRLLWR